MDWERCRPIGVLLSKFLIMPCKIGLQKAKRRGENAFSRSDTVRPRKVMKWAKAKTAPVVAGILAGAVLALVLVQHFRTRDLLFTSKKEISNSANAGFKALTGGDDGGG